MNYIWSVMVIASLVTGAFNGNIQDVLTAGLSGAENAVKVCLSFAGMMCFWSGMLSLSEKSGMSEKIARLMSPLLSGIFGKKSPALNSVAMNVTANMLGMGNAATPAGMEAMRLLDKENNSIYPDRKMAVFAVMNTASLQLVPTTVASMRASAGAAAPFDIIVPVWITSLMSLVCSAAIVCCIFKGKSRN